MRVLNFAIIIIFEVYNSKVAANKNKNSQYMLRVKDFNTICHHFFAIGSDV